MNNNSKQELIIVDALSKMVIPTEIFEKSEFKQIISNFKSAQEDVTSSLASVEAKQNAVKEGNALSNWWQGRNSELQDSQLNLNKSIGILTQQSSELILFNTAISKVLVSQQKVLHEQQESLQKQARELESQNSIIKNQQIELSEQQKKIEKANDGLLEAKGVTKEHAIKLFGLVERVEAAEKEMELSNQALERSILSRILACEDYAEKIKSDSDEEFNKYRQEAAGKLEEFSEEFTSSMQRQTTQLLNIESRVAAESDAMKQAITSATEGFKESINELQDKYSIIINNINSQLESATESFTSKISFLISNFNNHETTSSKRNKKLLYFCMSALILSVLSLVTSIYIALEF